MTTTGRTYRDVIGLTGPLLPVVSFLGRLPTATIQFGSVLLVARTSGSLAAAGLTGGALAIGQVACGPLVGRLADRHGQRTVVLAFSLANAAAIAALVAGALAGLSVPFLSLLGAVAGATVPLIGPLGRARLVALARRSAAPESTVGAALSFESTLDEISFVLGPALVGLAAVLAHPAYALGAAALLVALCGSGFALHPTAGATRSGSVATRAGGRSGPVATPTTGRSGAVVTPAGGRSGPVATPATGRSGPVPTPATGRSGPVPTPATGRSGPVPTPATGRPDASPTPATALPDAPPARTTHPHLHPRPRIPRSVHPLRAALALQGAMFGACQAGITALTERLGHPEQAGLVYAAMGVMSAVAGLSMAAVPARIALTARWRAATAAAFVLSLPLVWTQSMGGLYAVVTVLGVAYAPHLVTVFGLTERAVPPTRLAEAMAFATSAIVGGQALAVAVTGRLAESYRPAAAFAAASTAAALACAIALTARPSSYTGPTTEPTLPARVPGRQPPTPT
ncbi:MFS transporter [Streptomyces sp. NPDC001401]|uniref:MFS transporter n=1 Tax=Streptomyces sp. NPDC001401 TaxID=3364570 RepID=UPI00367BE9F2